MADQKTSRKIVDLMVALRQSLAGVPVTGDPAAKPFLDYDEKYDMAAAGLAAGVDVDSSISLNSNTMRGAGLEPARVSPPDPKSGASAISPPSR
jgi:hypothetical protein